MTIPPELVPALRSGEVHEHLLPDPRRRAQPLPGVWQRPSSGPFAASWGCSLPRVWQPAVVFSSDPSLAEPWANDRRFQAQRGIASGDGRRYPPDSVAAPSRAPTLLRYPPARSKCLWAALRASLPRWLLDPARPGEH